MKNYQKNSGGTLWVLTKGEERGMQQQQQRQQQQQQQQQQPCLFMAKLCLKMQNCYVTSRCLEHKISHFNALMGLVGLVGLVVLVGVGVIGLVRLAHWQADKQRLVHTCLTSAVPSRHASQALTFSDSHLTSTDFILTSTDSILTLYWLSTDTILTSTDVYRLLQNPYWLLLTLYRLPQTL